MRDAVVLLHRLGEFAATWTRVIPALVTSHRVVAPDLPGHGGSRHADLRLDGERMLGLAGRADREHLLGAARPRRPSPRGDARGALCRGAAATPRGLVLVGAYGLDRLRPTPRFAFALAHFLARPTERSQGALMRACLADRDALGEEMGERLWTLEAYALEEARAPGGMAAARTLMPALGLRPIPEEELARITAPTSLIWGREDRQVRLRVAEQAAARHGWPLHVIDGAAGDPAIERPKAFLRALRAELGDATGDGEADMEMHDDAEHVETIIIGAGRRGSPPGYHLPRRGRDFVILEADARVGDVWRRRFDSLRLYSPPSTTACRAWLPRPVRLPRGNEMADYLEAYAAALELPVAPARGSTAVPRRRDGTWCWPGRRRFGRTTSSSRPARGRSRSSRSSPDSWTRRSGSCTPPTTATRRSCARGRARGRGGHSGADIALELARDTR